MWKDQLGVADHFSLLTIAEGKQHGLDERTHVVLRGVEGQEDGFPVIIEVMHELHCLDALRRNLYTNHEWYQEHWEAVVGPRVHAAHLSHCINMIRQALMCQADVGVLPRIWVNTSGNAIPDFHRPHRCHDFGAVREFPRAHQQPQSIVAYEKNQASPPNAHFQQLDLFQ